MALRFSSFEDIKKRPNFDPTCHITPETLAELIGPYTFPKEAPEEPCQVWKPGRAKRCDEDHRNGWLGKNQNGREALIGSTCAAKYFHADKRFDRERKRVNAELEFLDLSLRYAKYREQGDLADKLDNARTRLRRVEQAISNINSILTERTLRLLESIAKTGNTTVTIHPRRVIVETVDGIEKQRVFYDRHPLGNLQGVGVFGPQHHATIRRGLEAFGAALRELHDHQTPRAIKIKSTLKALDNFKNLMDLLGRVESTMNAFLQETNLRLLCFTANERGTREAIAQLYYIVKDDGASELGNHRYYRDSCGGECARLITQMDDEVRLTIAHQGFEIP